MSSKLVASNLRHHLTKSAHVLRRQLLSTAAAAVEPDGKNSSGTTMKGVRISGRPLYLDVQATSPVDPRVLDAMLPFYLSRFGNPHSRTHFYGWESDEAVERARAQVASLIGASPKEIVFTSGATESNNISVKGVMHFYKEKKRHVITTQTEHKCVLDSCRHLQQEGFLVLQFSFSSIPKSESMAGLIRTVQRACIWKRNCSSSRLRSAFSGTSRFGTRTYAAYAAEPEPEPEPETKSPFDSNILRILRNEIEYQHEYAPPHQPETKFNSFTVEERRGEQVITIKGRFGESEDIKIEATMFDGCEHVPACGDDSSGVNVRLHLSLIVDISKGEGGSELEFVCSAWPECLNVEKVYILRRGCMPARSYLGPDFRDLSAKVQEKFYEYLDVRGVNNELAVFLHEYMMNKDRIELLSWMDSLKSFVER